MAAEIPMDVLEAYQNGESIGKIRKRLGVGTQRIREFLHANGIIRDRNDAKKLGWDRLSSEEKVERTKNFRGRPPKKFDENEAVRLLAEGFSPYEIGGKLHVDSRRIRKLFEEMGFSLEKRCECCHGSFRPRANNHQICEDCLPDGLDWMRRIYTIYGIGKKDWDRLIELQGGHCALCPRQPTVVDHDHRLSESSGSRIGTVRGILCNGCNSSLGRIDEDPSWAERAATYVQRAQVRLQEPKA